MTFFYDLNKKLAELSGKTKLAEDASWGMSEGDITRDDLVDLRRMDDRDDTDDEKFIDYVMSFYGPGGIYDMGVQRDDIAAAIDIYKKTTDIPYAGDSVDRENVRDILIDKFGYEWVNEGYAEESAVEEGNEFSGELAKAKAMGKKEFEVDGKKYPVKEEKSMPENYKQLKKLATDWQNGSDTAYDELQQLGWNISDDRKGVYIIKQTDMSGRSKIYFPELTEADVMSLEEGAPADEHAVRELVLFADNDHNLYRQSYEPIIKNLQRKVNKGVYDVELAKKLWGYHAERAAKAYAEQHGDGTPWNRMFSPNDRRAAAEQFEQNAREEIGAEEVAESQTDDVVHSFQDKHTAEKMKRLSNPRDYFESALAQEPVIAEDEDVLESLSKMLEDEGRPYVAVHARKGKTEVVANSSYEAAKKAAMKWGLKNTAGVDVYLADITHTAVDEDNSNLASPANPIRLYNMTGLGEASVMSKTKKKLMDPAKAVKHVVDPEQKEEVKKYQVTGRLDPKKFKKKFLKDKFPNIDKTDEQLSYTGEDATSRQYNGDGHNDAYAGLTFEDGASSSGGSISSTGGVTKHTAGGRYAAMGDEEDAPKTKKVKSGLGRGRPAKEKAPEYTKMNDPFGRVGSAPKGKKGTVVKGRDTHDTIDEGTAVDSYESPNYRQISKALTGLYTMLQKDPTVTAEEVLGHIAQARAIWDGDDASFGEAMYEHGGGMGKKHWQDVSDKKQYDKPWQQMKEHGGGIPNPTGKSWQSMKPSKRSWQNMKEEDEVEETKSYSAKAARAGKDIGKPGKNFEKIAKKAGEKYGSKEAGERVAGAVLKKLRSKTSEDAKPDFLDLDKDGNKSEPMKKAAKEKVDEKAVSKKQQKFMGMVHAAQKGEKPASKAVADVAKSMGKSDVKDFASTKHKGLPEKVKEDDRDNVMNVDNTAGAKETQTKPGSNKPGIEFGGSIYENFDAQVEQLISESFSINVSQNVDDNGEPTKNISVNASGDDAEKLAQILSLAGITGSVQPTVEPEAEVVNVADAKPELSFDVRDFCPVCDCAPCECGSHEELDEADVKVSDNEPDWPTNQETSDDALQYSGGLNKPKSTGQTTIPVIASQLKRQVSNEAIDIERSLFKIWKNYKG